MQFASNDELVVGSRIETEVGTGARTDEDGDDGAGPVTGEGEENSPT